MRDGRLTRRVRSLCGATGADEEYECTNCALTDDEWTGDCSECGRVVVRVVDARPVPDH